MRGLGQASRTLGQASRTLAQSMRGAHLKHLARTCDARHVETQRLVER